MRRIHFLAGTALFTVAGLLSGCSNQPAAPPAQPPAQPVVADQVAPRLLPDDLKPAAAPIGPPAANAVVRAGADGPDQQEKYDAAVLDALNLMAERKLPEALIALEAARSFNDTDFLRREIAKLRTRIEQQSAAERTVLDIQTVLERGKAAEASQLATSALQQYGATDAAPALTRLKLQADALLSAQLQDNAARRRRFLDEGEAAQREKNLRAAALAYEQALQIEEEDALRRQYDDLRAALARYDENRQKAAELRRDPAQLEDAVALLQEAAKAWDTMQVRQEIDEYTLALQSRRDRVSVAEFEVRGEVGIPLAGRTLAEEIMPHLRSRFEVMERGQLAKVLAELKLEDRVLADSADDQREVGRLARLRYLVLGSVTRLGGLVVNARLVEVRTGLVVQTARVTATTPEELMPLLPELAKVLLMSDEEKIAYEQQQARVARLEPQPVDAPLPPPPEAPAQEQPLPPLQVVCTTRPPELGGIRVEDFDRLPPPPPANQAPAVVVVAEQNPVVRQRLLYVSLNLGDDLFRRGRFREAHRHFELALNLAPGNSDINLRLDRCRPHLPPPPPPAVVVVVEQPPPPPPPRPRLAILDFVTLGDPAVVPPGLGPWAADNIAPYFGPPYEIVDRGEVFWWMGRLGMTYRDLMTDPAARRYLGRALNVRYFLLGSLRETASFDATTHLIDAETGYVYGAGRIHVHHPRELKVRFGELARLTLMSPEERLQFERQREPFQELVVKARTGTDAGNFAVAIQLCQDALKIRPNNVEVLVLLQRNQERTRLVALDEARQREFARLQAEAEAQRQRRLALTAAAEAARIRAAQQAAAMAAEQRRQLEEQRWREQAAARDQLLANARFALKAKNFRLSVQIFESAASLRPTEDTYRELALARAEADRAAQARAVEEQAVREAQLFRQREEDLVPTRRRLEEERRRRAAEEASQRQTQEKRDQAEYQRFFDEGQNQLNNGRFSAAITAFQAARRLRKTDAVEAMLTTAMVEEAKSKGEKSRLELERQLAEEKGRRAAAEAEAKRNQGLYLAALQQAQKALAEKNYDQAVSKYQDAGKIFRTDLVLAGLRQAEDGRTAAAAQTKAAARQRADDEQRAARFQNFMAQGRLALEARQYPKAVQAFSEAKNLSPNDVDALTGLTKAEQTQAQSITEARRKGEEQERLKSFQSWLERGKANLAGRQYDAAVFAFNEALKANPNDATALRAKQEAEVARQSAGASAQADAEAKKKAQAYQKVMEDGRLALTGRQFDLAIKSFAEAQKLLPGDQTSSDFLKQAQKTRDAEAAEVAARAKQRADELERAAKVRKALDDGRAALAARDLKSATTAFTVAAQLAPKDEAVVRAQEDLRKAQAVIQAEAEARVKLRLQHKTLLASGRTALEAKRYDEAVKALAEANALVPDDQTAQALLRQAQKAQADAKRTSDTALKQQQEEKQRGERVQQLLTSGRAALKSKEFDAAAKAFADAGKLAPRDVAVAQAVQDLAEARQTASAGAEKAKTAAAYQDAMKSGRQALLAKRYDDALKAFADAGRLQPGDREAATLLKQAQSARADAQAAEADAKKTADRVQQLLLSGQKALKAKQLTEASQALVEANKLAPQNPAVRQALADLDQARSEATAAAEKAKLRTSYDVAMKTGQQALLAKRYDDAVKSFSDAGRILPGDQAAATLLKQAEQARSDARKAQDLAAAAQKAEEQKRQADFSRLMTAGQTAMSRKAYDEAVRAYGDALKVLPGNAAATKALQDATSAQSAARIAPPAPKQPPPSSPAPKQPPPSSPNPQVEFQKQMDAGAALEKQKKYAEAMKAYQDALRLIPQDAKATASLRNAEFSLHMDEGEKHLQAKRFAEAEAEFNAALRLSPGNAAALNGVNRAKKKGA